MVADTVFDSATTELSVPAWMLERWRHQFGAEAAGKISCAALEEPEVYLNPDTGRRQDIGSQSVGIGTAKRATSFWQCTHGEATGQLGIIEPPIRRGR